MRRLLLLAAALLVGCPSDTPDDDDASGSDLPPIVESVTLDPAVLHTEDVVSAVVSASDPDLDPITVTYTWLVDGEVVAGETAASLDGELHFDKGQRVSVEVVATAAGVSSDPRASAEAEVLNSAPGAPTVAVSPNAPADVHDLECGIAVESVDDDGDAVTYTMSWSDGTGADRSGDATTGTLPGDTIPAAVTQPGETWTCAVEATDGTDEAPVVSSTVTIAAEDKDGDGSPAGVDCDDLNAVVYPGAPDACDGWDNDCDGRVEEFVAWWPLEGDGDDVTGAGSNLTVAGTTTWIAGVCGQALSLDQAQASVNDPGSLSNFYGTRGLTVGLWGRPVDCTVGGGDAFCPYVSKGDAGAGAGEEYTLGTDAARDSTFFDFQTGAGAAGAGVGADHGATSDWHALVATFDPAGDLVLYRDGVQVDSTAGPASPHAGGDVTFGTHPAGDLERGRLDVDEAFIANCPMPAANVQAHFDCGGCGCRGGATPCDPGEYWEGFLCAPVQ